MSSWDVVGPARNIFIYAKKGPRRKGGARATASDPGARARALWLSLWGSSPEVSAAAAAFSWAGAVFILFQSPNSHITSRSQGGHSVSDTSTRFSPTALPPSSTIESSCVHRCGRVLIARCRTWYRPLRAASPVCPSDPSRRSPWSSAPPAPRPAAPPPRPCCHLGCHGARYVRA